MFTRLGNIHTEAMAKSQQPRKPSVYAEDINEMDNLSTTRDGDSAQQETSLADYIHPTWGILLSVFGIVSHVLDVGSDIWLATNYYQHGHTKWGTWTGVFVLLLQLSLYVVIMFYRKPSIQAVLSTPTLPILL